MLKRSAGMIEGIEPAKELGCMVGEIDWLYVQAMCRSKDKYLFLKKQEDSQQAYHCLFSDHPGAIKKDLAKRVFGLEGSSRFHHQLVSAFNQSDNLLQFIKRMINIYREWLISGKKKLYAKHPYISNQIVFTALFKSNHSFF